MKWHNLITIKKADLKSSTSVLLDDILLHIINTN